MFCVYIFLLYQFVTCVAKIGVYASGGVTPHYMKENLAVFPHELLTSAEVAHTVMGRAGHQHTLSTRNRRESNIPPVEKVGRLIQRRLAFPFSGRRRATCSSHALV